MQYTRKIILRGDYLVTKTEIYNALVPLIVDINDTGIGQALFKAAKSGDVMELVRVTSNFRKEHTMLYKSMYDFVNELNEHSVSECEIFGFKENVEEGIFVYNPGEINASSLFALSYLTAFDESSLWECDSIEDEESKSLILDMDAYYDALEKESGSYDFADFVANAMFTDEEIANLAAEGFVYDNKYQLLVDVFAGKLKAYVNEEE